MNDALYEGIAIIGLAGRFPGADSIEEFWSNLIAGKESVSFFSDQELSDAGLNVAELKRRGQYVPARGVLSHADCFDAPFFGIHPKEAEVMDPQQRVFLESCWEALERAGYAPGRTQGPVGVFAGATFNTYYQNVLHQRPDLIELVGSDLVMFGNEKDYLTTRVAYKLGLKGPALNVSTACSTSLVSVCQACQSLLTYQCDMALAGGVSVRVPQQSGYYYDEGNIGSPDGHTRTFDQRAAGTAFSNGVGVVVLKRLEDAVKDRDTVYAVIKGAALNNDGSHRVSFGAPGVEGQSEVIAMAHAIAGVDPETITYVEAHGTATPLGDPIEVAGLTKAFRIGTQATQFCGIGSVKTNIGHLDAAAGVAGLIKTALALHQKSIPASLHFTAPNPKLDLENSPFYVNAELRNWRTKPGIPRRAGVSSFGTGGTNAHVVLEEAPELQASGPSRPWQLFPLSAKTIGALDSLTVRWSEHLKMIAGQAGPNGASHELADAAFTLQTGRSEFLHRRIMVCADPAEGAAALEARDPKRVFTGQEQLANPPVVFMFPGQGAQYAGMGAELYRSEPVFAREVDHCAEVLRPFIGTDLRTLLFPAKGAEKEANDLLVQTRFTQPALFVTEYALAKLWMSWGVQPAAMIGHSVGEYVAACLAGVFTLEDALALVARRAELVQAQPGGAMLAIRLPEHELLPLLNPQLSIAAINSPTLCVVSGPYEEIAALEEQLASRGVAARHLHTSHAFHSWMMEPVLAPFTELLRKVKFNEPRIPFVSNTTARWITPEEAHSPEYWAGHVRQTVRFAEGVAELAKDARNVLLEVGPGQTLSTLARQHPSKPAEQTVLASLPLKDTEEARGLMETLGRLWMAGVTVDWQSFYANERRCRVVAPTYPFERKRYWPQAPTGTVVAVHAAPPPPAPVEVAQLPAAALASASPVEPQPEIPRKDRLLVAARALLQELSGCDFSDADPRLSFMEMGLDSLLLTQASQLFQRKFGVPITFRQLMEELESLDAIAVYLDSVLPPEPVASAPAKTAATPVRTPASAANSAPSLPAARPALPEQKPHGPFKPIQRGADLVLSREQSEALNSWIARYTRRTAGSKKLAADNRSVLADPRSVSGFKQLWKEMVYPISTVRSDGSRVWDVDGNEYVDFVMGFGASMFGHRPPFVVQALHEQVDLGFEIGPIQPLAGEVASLVREFTGMQRVGFTNTGSEAVLAAMRVARTVTGRDKIAVFAGAYHGIFDEVLFRPLVVNGEMRTAAIAPGIPESSLSQVIVLDYGNPQSLEILRARGSEIAAVLVEPVQSRRLDLQPREFLHELRKITQASGSALIFDEIVTGFRVHPGGAQAYFGVRADLATYGKVIGGGLPLGLVTGDPKFMDALDGGQWQYGDTSFPEIGVTFFAGTFVRHPLALAAAKAVLLHLKQNGSELQRRLTERTGRVADELRALCGEFRAPYQITQFSSLMQVTFPPEQKFAGLLFYLLRDHGIHIYENRAFVMTTAHSEADTASLLRAFRACLEEMQLAGFVPGPVAAVPSEKPRQTPEPIPAPAEIPGRFPLTEAQKEIWLAAQMGGDAALGYNESFQLRFRGSLDVELFRSALRKVVERHPILLATFSKDCEWQQVGSDAQIDVPLLDFSTQKEPESELALLIDQEVSEPFDLATGPLLRIKIARLSENHHVVVWTVHHIVCDGWSAGILISELARIYSALKQGTPLLLEEPIGFQEYVRTASEDSPAAQKAMAYWQRQFAELPPPLNLPTDRARPAVRSARASTLRRDLDSGLHQALKRAAGKQRTTLVVLLMAGFRTLLHRLTGQTDIAIGLGVAGQAMTGQTSIVGHCINLVPVRTDLQPDASFQENLAAEKKCVLDAYDHYQSTLGGILRHLRVPRSPSRSPLVEVMFNLDKDPGAVEFSGLECECDRNPKRALHFDLFVNFVEGPGRLYLECDYNVDLFDATTIERWLAQYQTLLEVIAVNPAELVSKLPLLEESERRKLTLEWNATSTSFPDHLTLHERFERQVERTPDACALLFEDRQLTYRELNQQANQLAHRLTELGVTAESHVGICLERSFDLIVALLGILKAGGAYVPLDPEFPSERIKYLVDDAALSLIVTSAQYESRLPTGAVTLCLDRAGFGPSSLANPVSSSTIDQAAYIIYTSGSTGMPKGVVGTHQNTLNRLEWMWERYPFRDDDVCCAKTSINFVDHVAEIFGPMLRGVPLVIIADEKVRDVEQFVQLLHAYRITRIVVVPSFLREMLRVISPSAAQRTSLRIVTTSGEALSRELAQDFFKIMRRDTLLLNLYGSSEVAADVTAFEVTEADAQERIAIGRPISNTQIYILDSNLNPVPIGEAGELMVGGLNLARGYWNRPELTAQRFIPNPFGAGRLYRTGDSARWRPDGNIEYLGRTDFQVKIRGFRIELGEVEAVLASQNEVKQCVVVCEDLPEDKRLVAYFVPQGRAAEISELRARLRNELPEYMIPAAFVAVDKFPLTPSGKIDRKALATIENKVEATPCRVEPRDATEARLLSIWQELLRTQNVGLSDNFFDLGGHSLLAVHLFSEIKRVFGVTLPLATLFRSPTIEQLAQCLREDSRNALAPALVPVQTGGNLPPLYCVAGLDGEAMIFQKLAAGLGSNQPVFGLEPPGIHADQPVLLRIEDIAAHYVREILAAQPRGPYHLLGYSFGGLVTFEMAIQLDRQGHQVGLLALLDSANWQLAKQLPRKVRWEMTATIYKDHIRRMLFGPDRWEYLQGKIRHRLSRILYWYADKTGRPPAQDNRKMYDIQSFAGMSYQPGVYPGRLDLFTAAEPLAYEFSDPLLGWGDLVDGGIVMHEISGDHLSMNTGENLRLLCAELRNCLEQTKSSDWYDRIAYTGGVNLWWEERGDIRFLQANCLDISTRGLRVEAPVRIPLQSRVSLRVPELNLSASAILKHVESRGSKFILRLQLSQTLQDKIRAAIEKLRAQGTRGSHAAPKAG